MLKELDKMCYDFLLWLRSLLISDTTLLVWKSINDDQWVLQSEYRIRHKESELSMWIGNGSWFLDVEEPGGVTNSVGLFERHILWHFCVSPWLRRAKREREKINRDRMNKVISNTLRRNDDP